MRNCFQPLRFILNIKSLQLFLRDYFSQTAAHLHVCKSYNRVIVIRLHSINQPPLTKQGQTRKCFHSQSLLKINTINIFLQNVQTLTLRIGLDRGGVLWT